MTMSKIFSRQWRDVIYADLRHPGHMAAAQYIYKLSLLELIFNRFTDEDDVEVRNCSGILDELLKTYTVHTKFKLWFKHECGRYSFFKHVKLKVASYEEKNFIVGDYYTDEDATFGELARQIKH